MLAGVYMSRDVFFAFLPEGHLEIKSMAILRCGLAREDGCMSLVPAMGAGYSFRRWSRAAHAKFLVRCIFSVFVCVRREYGTILDSWNL